MKKHLIDFVSHLGERTHKRPSFAPGGFSIDSLSTDIHIKGGRVRVYVRGALYGTLDAVGEGSTLEKALQDAYNVYYANHKKEITDHE